MTGDITSSLLVLRGKLNRDARRIRVRIVPSSPLVDLHDQYQVYRSYWLSACLSGNDVLTPTDAQVLAELRVAQARSAQQMAAQGAI